MKASPPGCRHPNPVTTGKTGIGGTACFSLWRTTFPPYAPRGRWQRIGEGKDIRGAGSVVRSAPPPINIAYSPSLRFKALLDPFRALVATLLEAPTAPAATHRALITGKRNEPRKKDYTHHKDKESHTQMVRVAPKVVFN